MQRVKSVLVAELGWKDGHEGVEAGEHDGRGQ